MAGKKVNKTETQSNMKNQESVVAAAPVVAAPVVAAPVVQKGGRKKVVKATTEQTETPVAAVVASVVSEPVALATVTKQKGGRKAVASTTTPSVETPVVAATETASKTGKTKKAKVEKPVVTVTVTDETVADDAERRVRSFKVKLPNKEDFEGRFTGLTPYQAANKALSKYFRETEVPSAEITFSICESTRKSKKSVYTYVGKRQKLDVPVTYKIQDGREIVKNFKNSLKKVKKADTAVETTVA